MIHKKVFFILLLSYVSVPSISKSCGGFFDTEEEVFLRKDISVVLFDFDGTLADSFESAIAVANQLAREYNMSPISDEQKVTLRHVPLKDILLQYFKIPWYQIPSIVMRGKELINDLKYVDTLSPFAGMHDAMTQLVGQNLNLGILTSSNESRVRHFIKKHNFTCFQAIYADISLFGKHKSLQGFLDDYGLNAHNVIYVGDEVRDIEAAHHVGMTCIAVGWGYNSEIVLAQQKPYAVVKTPAELVEKIIGLAQARAGKSVASNAHA